MTWKEQNPHYNSKVDEKEAKYLNAMVYEGGENSLDCAILRMLEQKRFLELIHDFIVYDSGVKKHAGTISTSVLKKHKNTLLHVKAGSSGIHKDRESLLLWSGSLNGYAKTSPMLER